MTPQVGDIWVCDGVNSTGVFQIKDRDGHLEIMSAGSEVPWEDWDEVVNHYPIRRLLIWRDGRRY